MASFHACPQFIVNHSFLCSFRHTLPHIHISKHNIYQTRRLILNTLLKTERDLESYNRRCWDGYISSDGIRPGGELPFFSENEWPPYFLSPSFLLLSVSPEFPLSNSYSSLEFLVLFIYQQHFSTAAEWPIEGVSILGRFVSLLGKVEFWKYFSALELYPVWWNSIIESEKTLSSIKLFSCSYFVMGCSLPKISSGDDSETDSGPVSPSNRSLRAKSERDVSSSRKGKISTNH